MNEQFEDGTGSLWELIDLRGRSSPEATFAIDDLERTMTFGTFRAQVLDTAAGLADGGIDDGMVVAWQLPTWLETMVVAGALDRLGVVQVPILPMHRAREVSFIAQQSCVEAFLVPTRWNGFDHEQLALEVLPRDRVVTIDRGVRLPSGDPASLRAFRHRSDREPSWIFYTSGTTSDPKGVRHAHRSVLESTVAMCDRMRITSTDRSILAFPFTHIGGINWLMASMWSGCSLLVVERFADPGTMNLVHRSGITLAGVTTAFHQAYLAAQRAQPGVPLLPDVRAYPGGAAPKPPGLHRELVAEVGGVGIVSGYGLTEHPMVAMSEVDDPSEALATTEGRPSPGVRLDVVDPVTEGDCASGAEGEFRLRGPHLMLGYVDESLHVEAFDDEGRFRTGDLGFVDGDGRVVITGRLKDVIVRKGENISAQEIENLLFDLPGIAEAAVVGVPDEDCGERVAAVVVAVPGASIDLESLCTRLRAADLMAQKLPERLAVVDELPRNPTGKVRKDELRRLFTDPG